MNFENTYGHQIRILFISNIRHDVVYLIENNDVAELYGCYAKIEMHAIDHYLEGKIERRKTENEEFFFLSFFLQTVR